MESIVSEQKIHFLEYVQAELLQQYVREGIRYFFKTLIQGFPALVGLRYYSHEICTLLDFAKDYYFLTKHNATYAENFYGLQRDRPASNLEKAVNALIWTVIPYMLSKLQEYYNRLKQEQSDGVNHSLAKEAYKKIFPYSYAVISLISILLKFKYLVFPDWQHYNVLYKICKVKLKYKQSEQINSKYPIMQLVKTPGLLLLIMSHKALSWYFSRKKTSKANSLENINVQAPYKQQEGTGCWICGKNPKEAAFQKATGYIYCYDCISEYIRDYGKSPTSGRALTEGGIQMLYE